MLNIFETAPPTTVSAVAAVDLHRRYGDGDAAVDALRGVTLDVPAGRFIAVMGPSGSGKSTLMHIMAGLDHPTSGAVSISGRDLAELDDDALTKLRRNSVGFIFQSFNLVPTLSTEENIVLPERLAGRKPDGAWLDVVLERVGLSRAPRAPPRAALRRPAAARRRGACALQLAVGAVRRRADRQPRLARPGNQILGLMREAVDRDGQTIVMVTHDLRAAATADEVVVLADGEIVRRIARPERGHHQRDDARGGGMTRLAIADLRGHRLRTILSVIAVTLGVALVTGALTLTGTMTRAADSLSTRRLRRRRRGGHGARRPSTPTTGCRPRSPTLAAGGARARRPRPAGRRRRRRGPGRVQDRRSTARSSARRRTSASATTSRAPAPRS